MSDTERVVEIIRVMGMNNIQFSQKTGISPASLSHITSGRSNPTLTILRNIVESFPELNPEWVLLGRGDMFRNASTPENDQNTGANSLDDAAISPTGGGLSQENGLFTNEDFAPSFDFAGSNPPSETTRQGTTRQAVPGRSEQRYGNDGYGVKSSNTARSASHQGVDSNGNIDVTEIVRATVSQLQRPSRKIKEVHIFFDDGTYEIFGPTRRVE